MGYSITTGVIFDWNPDQYFVIHRAHHIWFDVYNYRLSIGHNHTTVSLLLQQDYESPIHN